jgi:LysM domain
LEGNDHEPRHVVLYRLTNNYLGSGVSLEVHSDGSRRLKMAPTGDYSGQHWLLVDWGNGKYALRTLYLGDGYSLDVINDGTNTTPWLASTGDFSGQYWTLGTWPDRNYRLTITGPGMSLDTYAGTHEPFLGAGDHSGQHWMLTRLRKILPATYTVVRGDSLSKIAAKLEFPGGWKTLYKLNCDVIGPNPDIIKPGQVLRLRPR